MKTPRSPPASSNNHVGLIDTSAAGSDIAWVCQSRWLDRHLRRTPTTGRCVGRLRLEAGPGPDCGGLSRPSSHRIERARRGTEAYTRIEALWRTWEALRYQGPHGIATWLLTYADPLMRELTSTTGPFRKCHPLTGEHNQLPPWTAEPPPPGIFT
ncbi:DUF4913 domain-containing protein [Raineyella antarctica]|uniref:DUF4913 domain-containing protein n=1 Tax=Raineyella antarctica TaxID=1577474 RepID=UPI000B85FA80